MRCSLTIGNNLTRVRLRNIFSFMKLQLPCTGTNTTGNFPATFTNGASLNSITDLQAYFPNNFTKINLPSFNGKTCTYTLAITLNKTTKEVSELTIVLKTLSDTKLTSAIKKIMSESVYDGRITVQSGQVKYTLKTSSMSYL